MSDTEFILVEEHTRPIITVMLVLRNGSLHDPPGMEGLSYLTGQMLSRGAGERNQEQFADAVDFLGSSLSVSTTRQAVTISGDVLTRNLDAFESLMADLVNAPRFEAEELAKLKRQTTAELLQVQEIDNLLCQRHFVRRIFDGHPYARPLKGTVESLERITLEDVVGHYRTHFCNDRVLVAACGDITRERLERLVERTSGQLPRHERPAVPIPQPVKTDRTRLVLVDKPERSQVSLIMGHLTVDGNHPDFFPLSVGNLLFGGTFTARLSQEIREKRGWSYGAYSYLHSDQHLGTFMMRFTPAVADAVPAMKLATELFETLKEEGVSEDEVDFAKRHLINSYPFTMDTPEKRLQERLAARLVGRPRDWHETYLARVADVTAADVNRAMKRHFTPDKMTVSVVATESTLGATLKDWPALSDVSVCDYREE